MNGLALPIGSRRVGAGELAFALAALAHVGLIVAWFLGAIAFDWFWPLVSPILLALFAPLVRRQPLTPLQLAALTLSLSAAAGLFTSQFIAFYELWFMVFPGLAVAGVICSRWPAPALIGVFLLTGSFGSLTAFWDFPAGESVDVLLGGLWAGAIWSWWFNRNRTGTGWLWPGVACMLAYVLLTAGEILLAETVDTGLQAFRAAAWYMAALVLVAYAPWPPGTRERMVKGFVAIAAAVGAYATFRWIVGPADAEREFASQYPNNFIDGELRLVGSFVTGKELAAWAVAACPFLVGFGLSTRSAAWRVGAFAAVGLLLVGMLGADVRAGPAALVPALLLVLVIYQLNPAFGLRRGVVTVVAAALAALGGAGAFALTLGDKQDTAGRYSTILNPSEDPAYQARLFKWRTALDTIDENPFGLGLGTAGRTAERARFETVAAVDVDNSYLKIALEQGFAVMAFFGVAMVLLLAGLVRRALFERDPERAGIAAGACGTLASLAVLFYLAIYIEGLPALLGWVLIGLGVSQVSRTHERPGIT